MLDNDFAPHELSRALASCLASEEARDRSAGVAFASALTAETLKLHPERLLRPADVMRLLNAIDIAAARQPGAAPRVEAAMRSPLALGLSCAPEPLLVKHMTEIAATRLIEDQTEQLIAAWRPPSVEFLVEHDYLEDLLDRDVEGPVPLAEAGTDGAEEDRKMRQAVFFAFGVRLRAVVFVADDTLPPRTGRLRIGHLPGALRALSVPAPLARPAPPGGEGPAQVSVAELVKPFKDAFWPLIFRLADTESVAYELSLLDAGLPRLVRAALREVTLAQLARLVRGLLREAASVRDLRTILERLVEFSAVPAPVTGAFSFDERLLFDERIAPEKQNMDAARLQFVRIGLRDAIFQELGGQFKAYPLPPDLDARLADHVVALANDGTNILTALELDILRDDLTTTMEKTGSLVLIATATIRLWLHDLLRDGLPYVQFLSWDEIPAKFLAPLIAASPVRPAANESTGLQAPSSVVDALPPPPSQ